MKTIKLRFFYYLQIFLFLIPVLLILKFPTIDSSFYKDNIVLSESRYLILILFMSTLMMYVFKNLMLIIIIEKKETDILIKKIEKYRITKIFFRFLIFLFGILSILIIFGSCLYILIIPWDALNSFVFFFKILALINILIYLSIFFDYYIIFNGKKLDIF